MDRGPTAASRYPEVELTASQIRNNLDAARVTGALRWEVGPKQFMRKSSPSRLSLLLPLAVVLVYPIALFAAEELRVTKTDGTGRTLTFSESQLRDFEGDPRQLIRVLQDQGVACCSPRKRLSTCIWACCDEETRIDTCGERLRRVLETLDLLEFNENVEVRAR